MQAPKLGPATLQLSGACKYRCNAHPALNHGNVRQTVQRAHQHGWLLCLMRATTWAAAAPGNHDTANVGINDVHERRKFHFLLANDCSEGIDRSGFSNLALLHARHFVYLPGQRQTYLQKLRGV